MSTITLELEDEVLADLQRLAERKGTTPESLLAETARTMSERQLLPLHPLLKALDDLPSSPEPASFSRDSAAYYDHMEKKHQ